jgi:3-hydroxyacyl-CoA dehydrogenase
MLDCDWSSDVCSSDLAARIESFPKPVVVAVQGRAIGGGVLLSLACHARIASVGASIALPEVRLGFVPGAGGTQRLPRLVGLGKALEVIALAETLKAEAAYDVGFFDSLVEPGALLEEAASRARAIAAGERPWRRTAEQPVPGAGDPEERAALRVRFTRLAEERLPGRQAPAEAIDLVLGAAETDFCAGWRKEKSVYDRLAASPETQALLHLFFASRAAAIDAGQFPADGDDRVDLVRPKGQPQSRLVELVAVGEVTAEAMQAALAEAGRQRLTPVLVRKESIAARLDGAYRSVAERLENEGYGAEAIAAAARAEGFARPNAGLAPKADRHIAGALLQAVIAEARHCLADGLAERSGDIDVIAVEACGFPERHGGPFFYRSTEEMPL